MGLIGRVGRKRVRARLSMAAIYGLLGLGSLTTVYPFLLMAFTGFKGPTDQSDNHLLPAYWFDQGKTDSPDPASLLGKYLADKYAGDASQIDSTRIGSGASKQEIERYRDFLMKLPLDHWAVGFRTASNQVTGRLAERYQSWLRAKYHDIQSLDLAYTETNTVFESVAAPVEPLHIKGWKPVKDAKYADWQEFKATLPAEYRLPLRTQRLFQEFLRTKYRNQFDQVTPEVAGKAKTFEAVALPAVGPLLDEFHKTKEPTQLVGSEVEDLWKGAGGAGQLPIVAFEAGEVAKRAQEIRGEMTGRNYRFALNYMLLHGNSMVNTLIFAALAILTQLTVNPLAAYALSRFPLRSSGKILLFLLATMAFPAEVSMIPSFLLLKGLGLLNTFAALVLPTAASGYMIFLLKGFFDSLPRELYDAGQMDGAGELTLLRRVALPLSRPVFGYLALLAFMGAYSAFLHAFLVAQDQRIWTLMVFIYQLSNTAPKATMMAALTLAAIPTLLVFLMAQRVVSRGIVLPSER